MLIQKLAQSRAGDRLPGKCRPQTWDLNSVPEVPLGVLLFCQYHWSGNVGWAWLQLGTNNTEAPPLQGASWCFETFVNPFVQKLFVFSSG